MMAQRLDQAPAVQALIPPAEPSIELRHFVLLTEPAGERKAHDYLKDQGFAPYVPMFNRTMVFHVRSFGRAMRRSRVVLSPIFKGYLFLPLNLAWDWGPIERAPGLRHNGAKFMTQNGHFKTLSPKDLSDIRRIEAGENFETTYKVGDEVRVLDGPFSELTARIDQLDDAQRITLLMDIFGRKTTIFATASQIAKVE